MRRALEICRLAAQLADREHAHSDERAEAHVTFEHIDAAAKELRGNTKLTAMQAAPKLELLVLIAAAMLHASTGRAEVSTLELSNRHVALTTRVFGAGLALSQPEHAEIVARLCASRLLAPAAAPGLVRLMVQVDDVKHVARGVAEFAELFPTS